MTSQKASENEQSEVPNVDVNSELDNAIIRRSIHNLRSSFQWLRRIIVLIVLFFLIGGLLYNLFASTEKDIPESVFRKLYSILESQTNPLILPISDPCLANHSYTGN